SVSTPFVLNPAGSATAYMKVELTPESPALGLNIRLVNWATVSVSPTVTAVIPLASSTVPSIGSVVTDTLSSDAEKLGSVGAGIPIGVAPLFGATASVRFVVTGGAVSAAIAS